MAHELKKRQKKTSGDVRVYQFGIQFIVSSTEQNYTVSELHHCITGKTIVSTSKRYFSIVVPQLDGEVFPTLWPFCERKC